MERNRWLLIFAAVSVVTIIVLVVTLGRSTDDKCNQFDAPLFLYITEEHQGIMVSWNHTWPNEECGGSYKLQYTLNEGQENVVYVHGRAYFFHRDWFDVCSSLYLRLWARNQAGELSNSSATEIYRKRPTYVYIGDIAFLPSDEGLMVTWTRPTGLDDCSIFYVIQYSTDAKGVTRNDTTYTESFLVPDTDYCFYVSFDVYVHVFERVVSAALGRYYNYLEEPQDVELTSLPAENTLIASWRKHDKQDLCEIEYKVLYEYADFSQIFRTREPSINLDIAYCTLATVEVSTVRGSDERNAVMANHKEEQPASLGPIQNPKVHVTEENGAIISWNPPEYASECTDLEYIVSARNEATEENGTCTGKITCSLSLSSFCPATTFIVREISDITQENSIRHIC